MTDETPAQTEIVNLLDRIEDLLDIVRARVIMPAESDDDS